MKGKRGRKEEGKDRKGRMEEGKGVERKKASLYLPARISFWHLQ